MQWLMGMNYDASALIFAKMRQTTWQLKYVDVIFEKVANLVTFCVKIRKHAFHIILPQDLFWVLYCPCDETSSSFFSAISVRKLSNWTQAQFRGEIVKEPNDRWHDPTQSTLRRDTRNTGRRRKNLQKINLVSGARILSLKTSCFLVKFERKVCQDYCHHLYLAKPQKASRNRGSGHSASLTSRTNIATRRKKNNEGIGMTINGERFKPSWIRMCPFLRWGSLIERRSVGCFRSRCEVVSPNYFLGKLLWKHRAAYNATKGRLPIYPSMDLNRIMSSNGKGWPWKRSRGFIFYPKFRFANVKTRRLTSSCASVNVFQGV